jgi:cytochrome P450
VSTVASATGEPVVVTLTGFHQVREAYRQKPLRQAMYTEGAVVMADCLLDLHGPEHRDRRRLENRLFRREVFARWEQDLLGATVQTTLAPMVASGHGDLLTIGYRCAMNLTAAIAGVDHDPADQDATDELYAIVRKFSEGATLVHSTRDHDEVRAEVLDAIDRFDADLLQPSIARRRALLDRVQRGEADQDELPADVLTTLLRNEDDLHLPPEVLRREISFYLQAGAHSTANAFTHTVDELAGWAADHPEAWPRAAEDPLFAQRCVHESLRLNPASPEAWRTPLDHVELSDGTELPPGALVVLDLAAANRDPAVWGGDGTTFDPERRTPDDVGPWGHSFGGGMHACIGAELDGGMECPADRPPADHLYGTVCVMVQAFLRAGGRPDPEQPPVLDPHSERRHFSSYPVLFSPDPTPPPRNLGNDPTQVRVVAPDSERGDGGWAQ